MSNVVPTADDLDLAREIVEELALFEACSPTIASLIAKHRQPDSRRTITLCGSTRFKRAWLEWNARLTIEGNVVFSVAMWSHDVRIEPTDEQKIILDEIHKAKIDRSDEIFVLDVGGYIGSSTQSEIEHAERTGKAVRYLSREFPDWTEEDCVYAAKHRQPPPAMTQEEVYAEIERVLNCKVKYLFDVPGRQSPPGWEVALRKILDDIRVAARVDDREFRLKSIDQLVAAIIAPKGQTP